LIIFPGCKVEGGITVDAYNDKAQQIMDEVNKVVIGKRQIIEKALTAILAKGHILLEDFPEWGRQRWHWHFPRLWHWSITVCNLHRMYYRRMWSVFIC
jgi:MoxR-like ATPase